MAPISDCGTTSFVAMKNFVENELRSFAEAAGQTVVFAAQRGGPAFGIGRSEKQTTIPYIYFDSGDNEFSLTGNYGHKNQIFRSSSGRYLYVGKDLRLFLLQMARSMPVVIEDLFSPVIFLQKELVERHIRPMAIGYFCPKTTISYYLDKVSSFGHKWEGHETIPLQEYLESIRALLAAKWIAEEFEIQPVMMDSLLEEVQDQDFVEAVNLLRDREGLTAESLVERSPVISEFFQRQLAKCSETARRFPKSNYSQNTLNVLYRRLMIKLGTTS